MDFKREKSYKSKTVKEIVLTQEDRAKYTKLYNFLLQDSDDESKSEDGTSKFKTKNQSTMNFKVPGQFLNDSSVDKYNNFNFQKNEDKNDIK